MQLINDWFEDIQSEKHENSLIDAEHINNMTQLTNKIIMKEYDVEICFQVQNVKELIILNRKTFKFWSNML